MRLDGMYDVRGAAEYLGVLPQTVLCIVARGDLSPIALGHNYLFYTDDLKQCKAKYYADGLTHTQIAKMYNVSRGIVMYHFKRLRVNHIGVDRRQAWTPWIYDPETVRKFALISGLLPFDREVG